MLSHIKAPLREEKREVASYPGCNLAKMAHTCKCLYERHTENNGNTRAAHVPEVPTDLGAAAARERLSPPALKAFFTIMARWKVQTEAPRDPSDPSQWSDAGLAPAMREHLRSRIALSFERETISAIRAEWL